MHHTFRNGVSNEDFCHVNLKSLNKLKDSTLKLLQILNDIQSSRDLSTHNVNTTQELTKTEVEDRYDFDAAQEDDNCTIYDRLTGKCRCFNVIEYNDLMMNFGEETKHKCSTLGAVIKNIRIIKKYLYIGGSYTKNALIFINQGLTESNETEKAQIIEGCTHADICNIFEDYSLVKTCIAWLCKKGKQDYDIQALAVGFLYKLSQEVKGRMYLNLNSKIGDEIKNMLIKRSSKLEFDTLIALNATLNYLKPPLVGLDNKSTNIIYYDQNNKGGMSGKLLQTLENFRNSMSMSEILTHLDLLRNISESECGRKDMKFCAYQIIELFKSILMQYNNSDINLIISNILGNILPRQIIMQEYQNSKIPPIHCHINKITVKDSINEKDYPGTKINNKAAEHKPTKHKTNHRKKQFASKRKLNTSVIVVPLEIEGYPNIISELYLP